MPLLRTLGILFAAALLTLSSGASPAGAAARKGTFAGCRWDYTSNQKKAEMLLGITDAADDGHGCTITAIEDSDGFAASAYVDDRTDVRHFIHMGTTKGHCLTIIVYGAAAPDFGSAMPKKQLVEACY